jgi:RecA-family ATPase
MRAGDIRLALSGDELIQKMLESKDSRKAIAEGFLFENTIIMMAADPGVGKSTVATQIAIELSSGVPVLGLYAVPRPMKVLYILTERSVLEFLERAEVINKIIPINKNTLVVTDEYKVLNLLNFEHVQVLIDCIHRDCHKPDIIFVDPIYPMVSGGLSKDEPASAFTKAMSLVQKETGAILYYNHHTSRPMYGQDGTKTEKDDPFYGSQWLKAHVTASYHMKQSDLGVNLLRKKDNYKIMPKEIHLDYDAETELCSVGIDDLPALGKVRAFIEAQKKDNKTFSFHDMQSATKLCTRYLRAQLKDGLLKSSVEVVSSCKNKNLYRISTHAQTLL